MTERFPITLCWHCDRPLDAATEIENERGVPSEGAISLCLYCGAVGIFTEDLRLIPATKEQLDAMEEDKEFLLKYCQFAWARQYVMLNANLIRERDDPDR